MSVNVSYQTRFKISKGIFGVIIGEFLNEAFKEPMNPIKNPEETSGKINGVTRGRAPEIIYA